MRLLIEKYEHRVAATVIGMLGFCPVAEDIGQETFLRFYQSLKKFRGESNVGTYLTRIAINLSLNELKRRKLSRKYLLSYYENKVKNLPAQDEELEKRELRELIHKALQKLEPKFRSVIVLRLIDGYSTKETARILKLPRGTVLSRLFRAQIKLKEILKPLLETKVKHE